MTDPLPPPLPPKPPKPPEVIEADNKLRAIYINFLADEGYRPKEDSDGDVQFMKEGKTYYIIIDGRDPQFFRISFPNFWPIESEEERRRAYESINHANRFTKVAKFVIGGNNNVSASAELLVADPAASKLIFNRAMGVLTYGFNVFAEKMKALAPPPVTAPTV